MSLASVQGQDRAVEALKAALRSESVHHAYLFGGPEGVGKELTAIGFAQALMCADAPGVGCGSCSTCQRIERRNHPDVTWLMPEQEMIDRGLAGRSDFTHAPSREIRVEQVRGLQERLALRPLESRRKVAILASAHALNQQAQNAFLKTLEEPPKDTTLILLASAPDKLLPTIRSRCSKVHFGPLPSAFIAERVMKEHEVDEATAKLVAVMSNGSLSKALELDPDRLALRKDVIERFEALQRSDARGWVKFAEDFASSRETAEDCLQVLAVWMRDVTAAKVNASSLANEDLRPLATAAAAKVSEPALHRRMTLVDQAYNAVAVRNGGARLQLERMLIEMLG
jgi:DNA polymerase-3 subunit delta'